MTKAADETLNIRRILCPIDYSALSEAANSYASLLAKTTGAEIIYLHCRSSDMPYVGFCDADAAEEDKPKAEELRSLHEVHPKSADIR